MSDRRLEGKVCVVTGSTAGIGAATAKLFAEHGGKVVVSGRRAEKGEAVVRAIREAGHTAHFLACDVADDVQMDALIQGAVQQYGGIDVLVNNAADVAGSHGPGRAVADLSLESWDGQIRTNLRSVFYLSKLAIPLIRERGGGAIVNVSSVGSVVGWENGAAYLASKGAINQLTRSMAIDYMRDRIRVNALCPGWIMTEIEQARVEANPSAVENLYEDKGITRMGEPREMAYAALFLACNESSYVTGSMLFADGGWTLQ